MTISNKVEIDDDSEPTEQQLIDIAKQLNLKEDEESLEYLRLCVIKSNIEDTELELSVKLQGEVQMDVILEHSNVFKVQEDTLISTSIAKHSKPPKYQQEDNIIPLSAITCILSKKQNTKEIDHFIQNFLFQPVKTQLREIDLISFSSTDDFDTWHFDHLRDIFDLWIVPDFNNKKKKFPQKWQLATDAKIFCKVTDSFAVSQDLGKGNIERPNTQSLETFIKDICLIENCDTYKHWIQALRLEDITTYSHLSNLKQTDWDNIAKLTMNAKKTIKSHVDKEKQTSANEKRKTTNKTSFESNDQDDHVELKKYPLAKLEYKCIEKAFEEMRAEGYADDGLFDDMVEFFLPLTITEDELETKTVDLAQLRKERTEKKEVLMKQIEELNRSCNLNKQIYWDSDETYQNTMKKRQIQKDQYEITKGQRCRLTDQEHSKWLRQLEASWREQDERVSQDIVKLESSMETLDKTIKQQEADLDDKQMELKNIDEILNAKPKPVDKRLVKAHRGFIMYGPPGTGKSVIMSKLAIKVGIAMIGPPLAAGELNRPLVGESERILVSLCTRAHRIPYLQCCVSIDEIDSLAPKRDEDSSEGKVDKISVLLSLIEGIKDVPNLMFFCATNRLHMMDEAFLRRMSGKYFVGRPSSNSRRRMLSDIPEWALEANLLEKLSIATTNFSGAAVSALSRSITVRCMTQRRHKADYRLTYHEALTLADSTAKQYQILLGSETLPRLLLRNLSLCNNASTSYHLKDRENLTYTGRIVINLYDKCVRIETTSQSDRKRSVIEQPLDITEVALQQLLERITSYGKDRNVQLLQLIDLNLLSSQGAYDEKKVFETLKERYDECISYKRSMIVYDLDSLIGINKSESDSSMGRSISSSVNNHNIYTYVRARFREAVIETSSGRGNMAQNVEKWAVAVVREQFLLRQFCIDVEFTRTKQEENEIEEERRKSEDLLKCVKCKDYYIENENKMGNCTHHDGFLYDNSAPDLMIYTLTNAIELLNQNECDALIHPERREDLERQKLKYKWICCDGTLTTGNVGGCKKGKHGFKYTTPHRARTTATILDRNQIEQWEQTCRSNEEYNEKWLTLLTSRGNR
ncbi:unnamed protein product [Didymodactylos carnosus]|uniref:AAA+ ATPase domain-containing protein n=1 Tax=Didymodactylos carnosus TaxID=1234261 RepID=A0A8S2K0R6_9BILA|nr:unnamed protein product [Didymodactylos carnosus]CAF3821273.1 unnamed protein product [Didymodactylos carnosus]